MTRVHLVLPIELTNGNDGRTKHFGQAAARLAPPAAVGETARAATPEKEAEHA